MMMWTRLSLFTAVLLNMLTPRIVSCCQNDKDCGWRATCNSTCVCPPDYTMLNGRDCANKNCTSVDGCLECSADGTCQRCAYFIEENTQKCLTTCTGEAKVVYEGNIERTVCMASSKNNNMEIIIGVVVGVSSGLVLFAIFAIAFCCYIKRTRGNVNLQQRHYTEGMLAGKLKQVSVFDNTGFEPEDSCMYNSVVDKDAYLLELEKLRPHAPTLLIILNSIRRKVRAMDSSDARIPTYKGVIHQLCRVLVLLHKKDPALSIPSDAMGLMEWATQMLEDHRMETQESYYSGGATESSTSKISYVDVPVKQQQQQQQRPAPSQNFYATPKIQRHPHPPRFLHTFTPSQLSSQSLLSDAGYYSSVPVPVDNSPNSPKFKPGQSSSQPNTLTHGYEIPWNIKLKTDSLNTLNCSGSDVTMGYFANGRYYDPTPRNFRNLQQHNPRYKSEIYAPASSYSDRSNPRFSTFVKETSVDISRSVSEASEASGEEGDYMRNEDEEELPFDPKDLTEPVEV